MILLFYPQGLQCPLLSPSIGDIYIVEIYIYKWKNHFSEMKGDVGMSLHEKEGEQEDA